MKTYIILFRFKHWLKNFILFFPIFFAGELFDKKKLFLVIIGFFSISFVSSAGYIFNNLIDEENDLLDFSKKIKNPIANENIQKSTAVFLLIIFLIAGFLIAININIHFFIATCLYFLNTFLYSLFFKNIIIIDLISIALGFILRLWLGGLAANIKISNWLFILVLLVSFILGAGKRYEEMNRKIKGKIVLQKYNKKFLEILIISFSFLSIIFFGIYLKEQNRFSIFLILLSIFLMINYLYSVFYRKKGEPTDFLTENIFNIIMLGIWFFLFFKKIYL